MCVEVETEPWLEDERAVGGQSVAEREVAAEGAGRMIHGTNRDRESVVVGCLEHNLRLQASSNPICMRVTGFVIVSDYWPDDFCGELKIRTRGVCKEFARGGFVRRCIGQIETNT